MINPRQIACCVLALASLGVLGGCSSVSVPVLDVVGGVLGGQRAGNPPAIPDAPNPSFRYLRVEVQGRPAALLVLGYVDPSPMGDVEVWYSSKGEVIRTLAGRIVGTAGLEVDWRAVRYRDPPPAWHLGLPAGGGYERSRDVMPGYRFSVRESLSLIPVKTVPSEAMPMRIPPLVAWYLEPIVSPEPAELPPAVYAIARASKQAMVVYSRQCLSAAFCLHLQPWPVPSVEP